MPLRDCALCLSCGGYAGILVIPGGMLVHLAIAEVGESLSIECLFNFCHLNKDLMLNNVSPRVW